MNKVPAIVKEIVKTDIVTYIVVASGEKELRLIRTKLPDWLEVGDKVYCQFPEASVCVSKECPGKVSIENRIPATIKSMRQSESLCEITFESAIGSVVSLITGHAMKEMELENGSRATMLIRGVDIMLEPTPDALTGYRPGMIDAN